MIPKIHLPSKLSDIYPETHTIAPQIRSTQDVSSTLVYLWHAHAWRGNRAISNMKMTLTKNAHDPMKVARVDAYSIPGALMANPSAPQRVKPIAPIRFQKPICHPRVFNAGLYHFFCVSSMNNQLEMMNPEPPTTCLDLISIEDMNVFIRKAHTYLR